MVHHSYSAYMYLRRKWNPLKVWATLCQRTVAVHPRLCSSSKVVVTGPECWSLWGTGFTLGMSSTGGYTGCNIRPVLSEDSGRITQHRLLLQSETISSVRRVFTCRPQRHSLPSKLFNSRGLRVWEGNSGEPPRLWSTWVSHEWRKCSSCSMSVGRASTYSTYSKVQQGAMGEGRLHEYREITFVPSLRRRHSYSTYW